MFNNKNSLDDILSFMKLIEIMHLYGSKFNLVYFFTFQFGLVPNLKLIVVQPPQRIMHHRIRH